MSKIQEVLRLKYLNQLSNRNIESIIGISRNSVANYVKIFETIECSIEEVLNLSSNDLEDLFHPNKKIKTTKKVSYEPDWNQIQQELTQKGMTRKLLYEELKESNPNIYSYSQFNCKYKKYVKRVNPSMRQIHYGGDKLFIDYSGLTMPIVDAITNTTTKAQIFVSVLGASGYTFVHATASQSTKDFIQSHVAAFSFYGGMPNILLLNWPSVMRLGG